MPGLRPHLVEGRALSENGELDSGTCAPSIGIGSIQQDHRNHRGRTSSSLRPFVFLCVALRLGLFARHDFFPRLLLRTSKVQLERKLILTFPIDRRSDDSDRRVPDGRVRQPEVWMVRQVERLGADLQPKAPRTFRRSPETRFYPAQREYRDSDHRFVRLMYGWKGPG